MPDSLATVSGLIKAYPSVPVINHLPGNYYWPSYRDAELANKLQLRSLDFKHNILDPRQILSRVCAFTDWYGYLPFLYHGFVDARHITKIKSISGSPFFGFCAPDIYSDIVLALHTHQLLVVNKPLTLGGQSASSNGANYASKNSIAKQFINELPAHLRFTYESMSISLAVYNAIEIAFRVYPEQSSGLHVDMRRLLENSIREVTPYGDDAMLELRGKLLLLYPEALVDKVFKAINANDLDAKSIDLRPTPLRTRIARRLASLLSRLKSRAHPYLGSLNKVGKVPPPLPSAVIQHGLHWHNGSIVLNGYLDLNPFNITTANQAAWFLHQRLKLLGCR